MRNSYYFSLKTGRDVINDYEDGSFYISMIATMAFGDLTQKRFSSDYKKAHDAFLQAGFAVLEKRFDIEGGGLNLEMGDRDKRILRAIPDEEWKSRYVTFKKILSLEV